MYATRAARKSEISEMRQSIPSPMGHLVTGYEIGPDGKLRNVIETDNEIRAANTPRVCAIRRRMPNGRFIYRVITSKPSTEQVGRWAGKQ